MVRSLSAIAKRARHHSRRDRQRPGATPGTLAADPGASQSRVSVVGYHATGADPLPDATPADLPELAAKYNVVWINVDGLADVGLIEAIGDAFGFARLSLEDVLHVDQRPKIEAHDGYEFVVVRKAGFGPEGLESEQVALFFGKGFVVTFHERTSDYLEPVRERFGKNRGKTRKGGSDYLAYAVIDCVIDHYFPALQSLAARIADLDTEIFTAPKDDFPNEVRQFRADLQSFLGMAMPTRDVLNKLITDVGSHVAPGTKPYLRDCLDHILQVIDQIETFRYASTDLMNHFHTQMTQKMNEAMKVLTIIATVFIPLTFVTSIYGMNFDPESSPWNMPELKWAYGYPTVLVFMLVLGAGMMAYFHRKGWLGSGPRRRPPGAH